MKRKLEIIRSLMHRPSVLFLDEPTSGLDPVSRHSLWQYLRSVRTTEGTTIFLTTHYLEEAEEADRICILDKGRVKKLGTPRALKADLLQEFLVVDAADRPALRRELEAMGLTVRRRGPFQVILDGHSSQEVISGIRSRLTLLETHAPSLVDAYLKIVEARLE